MEKQSEASSEARLIDARLHILLFWIESMECVHVPRACMGRAHRGHEGARGSTYSRARASCKAGPDSMDTAAPTPALSPRWAPPDDLFPALPLPPAPWAPGPKCSLYVWRADPLTLPCFLGAHAQAKAKATPRPWGPIDPRSNNYRCHRPAFHSIHWGSAHASSSGLFRPAAAAPF